MLYFLYYSVVKNVLPVIEIENGGCLQDGVEIAYIFHQIFSNISKMANKTFFIFHVIDLDFWLGNTLILFYYSIRTTTYQKLRTFHLAVMLILNLEIF
jgi:hypothetical protein